MNEINSLPQFGQAVKSSSSSIPRVSVFVNTTANPPQLEVESNLSEGIQIIGLLAQAISLLVVDAEKKKQSEQRIVVPSMSVPNISNQ